MQEMRGNHQIYSMDFNVYNCQFMTIVHGLGTRPCGFHLDTLTSIMELKPVGVESAPCNNTLVGYNKAASMGKTFGEKAGSSLV